MTTFSTIRQASTDEIAAEMDRRGEVIMALEYKIEILTDLRKELNDELKILRDAQSPAGNLKLLYEIREAMGWNDKTSLSIMPNGIRDLRKDSLRYRYLKDHCSCHYPMTHEQPAGWSISWEFQQGKPHEAYGTYDYLIDADIERQRQFDEESADDV